MGVLKWSDNERFCPFIGVETTQFYGDCNNNNNNKDPSEQPWLLYNGINYTINHKDPPKKTMTTPMVYSYIYRDLPVIPIIRIPNKKTHRKGASMEGSSFQPTSAYPKAETLAKRKVKVWRKKTAARRKVGVCWKDAPHVLNIGLNQNEEKKSQAKVL